MSQCPHCFLGQCQRHRLQDHGKREMLLKAKMVDPKAAQRRLYESIVTKQLDKLEAAARGASETANESYKASVSKERDRAERRGNKLSSKKQAAAAKSRLAGHLVRTMLNSDEDSNISSDDRKSGRKSSRKRKRKEKEKEKKKRKGGGGGGSSSNDGDGTSEETDSEVEEESRADKKRRKKDKHERRHKEKSRDEERHGKGKHKSRKKGRKSKDRKSSRNDTPGRRERSIKDPRHSEDRGSSEVNDGEGVGKERDDVRATTVGGEGHGDDAGHQGGGGSSESASRDDHAKSRNDGKRKKKKDRKESKSRRLEQTVDGAIGIERESVGENNRSPSAESPSLVPPGVPSHSAMCGGSSSETSDNEAEDDGSSPTEQP